jgi:hypothetical protein
MSINQTGRRRIFRGMFATAAAAFGARPFVSRLFLAVWALSWCAPTVYSAPSKATPRPSASAVPDSIAEANRMFVATILKEIAGRDTQPAERVFKNVTLPQLQNTQARTFLSIMSIGYAQALGVRCTYCHVETDFASDSKRPKRAAREMAVMHRMINTELRKMQHIPTPASEDRAINCATCHRGKAAPLR